MRFFRFVGVLLVIILAFTAFSAFNCGDSSPIISISLSPFQAVMLTYDPPDGNTTQTFTASVVRDDQTQEDGTDDVDWMTGDSSVAFFVDNVLHPAGVGTTTAYATAEGGDVSSPMVNVTVNPPFAVISVDAGVSPGSIDIGDTATLTMMAMLDTDNDGNPDQNYDATSITNWSIDSGDGDGTFAANIFTATDDGPVVIEGAFDDGGIIASVWTATPGRLPAEPLALPIPSPLRILWMSTGTMRARRSPSKSRLTLAAWTPVTTPPSRLPALLARPSPTSP